MLRCMRVAEGLVLVLSLTGRDARAQYWRYGGWGWGGWGTGTPQSLALQGAGYYAMGSGVYNLDTAMANSINADTAIRWNDYVAQVTHEAALIHAARVHQEFLRDKTLYDAHQKQLRDNPSQSDIDNGNALNAAVTDLSDPRLGESALRGADASVRAGLIAEVPFENASERVTIMLDQLRNAFQWPAVFEGERFASDKKLFDELITRARREDQDGEVSEKTIQQARNLIQDLRNKATARVTDPDDQRQALRFINAYTALIGLLDKPDTRAALAELRKVRNTTIASLLGFMHSFNLRFAPARTLRERNAYRELYAILHPVRDRILSEAKLETTATARATPNQAYDYLQNLGRRGVRPQRQPAPQPPPPQNPR